ncbi:MAG: SsrA-binding protein [Candidatus Harrisonbacteria bacterium CG10_big_fil_rev_8_21_14_0_10_40_38]|uniref:SsrA-binding protein n=1 Tax=Candidatus Harrisonbacteria bacterium CG10_big_fil_rev_8_21_14_0_10_40_38 TaxID=1974583 RepID=A0A2H0URH3_9BACT|nr:MAG: SsrA-binding protein [Candidatus Harrisonbacteria bacterium CG10_big_fil_rev_8_21_14_0_10_40_38]
MEILSENRRARFDYDIIETFEAGIELKGFEVKAAKKGRAGLAGSFVRPENGELFLTGTDIPPYQADNTPKDYDQKRTRRLLMKSKEIAYLVEKVAGERLTIVPTKMYNKRGLVKLEIALAKSKKKADKRETIKKRDTDRHIDRTLKSTRRR